MENGKFLAALERAQAAKSSRPSGVMHDREVTEVRILRRHDKTHNRELGSIMTICVQTLPDNILANLAGELYWFGPENLVLVGIDIERRSLTTIAETASLNS
jgi:hypothetical protein